jgi:cobalt-zinc-cadmium efflux system protein
VEIEEDPEISDHKHNQQKTMVIVFTITLLFMFVEVIVGFISGSLSLLADSGHMLSDVLSIGVSLFALRLATRPRTARFTFGFSRAEILAALFNGSSLVIISIVIVGEAFNRMDQDFEILGAYMLITAVIGLLVNIYALLALSHHHDNMNMSSVYYHVLSDLLGSVATIAAGILILITDMIIFDLIVSVIISVLIAISGLKIIKRTIGVLMQEIPEHIDIEDIESKITSYDFVDSIHHLHVWTLDGTSHMLSSHIIVSEICCIHQRQFLIDELENYFEEKYNITCTTLQIELDGDGNDEAIEDQKCTKCNN